MFFDRGPRCSLRCCLALWVCSALATPLAQASDAAVFSSWRALRDAGVVKQASDFSCGLAALATYFTTYLNDPLSEAALLRLLEAQGDDWGLPADWREQGVSYAILIALATHLGVQGVGLAVTPERLLSLQVPAIVRLHPEGGAHFSVLRGIDPAGRVQLADPRWGNRQLSRAQFLDLWLDPTLDAEVGTLLLLHNTRRTRQQREGYFTLVPRLPLLRPGLNMALSAGWFADGR
jgi:hypothetical protein